MYGSTSTARTTISIPVDLAERVKAMPYDHKAWGENSWRFRTVSSRVAQLVEYSLDRGNATKAGKGNKAAKAKPVQHGDEDDD